MNVTCWVDPVDHRVFVSLGDALVVRLSTADAARLRDQLCDLLGEAPTRTGPRSSGEKTGPTGR